MISIIICVILLPFALMAALFSLVIVLTLLPLTIYALWFIATHGWTEFKTRYIDVDDA